MAARGRRSLPVTRGPNRCVVCVFLPRFSLQSQSQFGTDDEESDEELLARVRAERRKSHKAESSEALWLLGVGVLLAAFGFILFRGWRQSKKKA